MSRIKRQITLDLTPDKHIFFENYEDLKCCRQVFVLRDTRYGLHVQKSIENYAITSQDNLSAQVFVFDEVLDLLREGARKIGLGEEYYIDLYRHFDPRMFEAVRRFKAPRIKVSFIMKIT